LIFFADGAILAIVPLLLAFAAADAAMLKRVSCLTLMIIFRYTPLRLKPP